MHVCVVGAGAIGGLIAVKLSTAGEDVCVIDRGAHLATIKNKGLHLRWHDGTVWNANVRAYERTAEAGEQDLVILGVKAYDLEAVAPDLKHLLGPKTMIMTLQNGIPWWYFQKEGGRFDGRRLESLDPTGILSKTIDSDRLIGCVAYPAATLTGPGIIHHVEGERFPMGELNGTPTQRVTLVSESLINAGLKSRVLTDVRSELWLKAWGSLSFNPISVLTRATMAGICRSQETRQLAAAMMAEAQGLAAKLNITFRHTIEQRVEGAENVGEHKTSMLQDFEAGRRLETEALIGSILEMGRMTDTPTPLIEAVYALLRLLECTVQASGGPIVNRDTATKAA